MYKTKYGVSLRPNCFKSSPRSPPQLSAQIFNCPVCSAVRWCSGHNLGILVSGPLGPFSGWGTLAGLWLPVVSAYLLRVMLQWVRSDGRWLPGPLVQPVPAGGLRGSLRGVHESMDLVHYVDGQPIAATLLVASKISLRLLWCYSCMLLIVFLLGIKLLLLLREQLIRKYGLDGKIITGRDMLHDKSRSNATSGSLSFMHKHCLE